MYFAFSTHSSGRGDGKSTLWDPAAVRNRTAGSISPARLVAYRRRRQAMRGKSPASGSRNRKTQEETEMSVALHVCYVHVPEIMAEQAKLG
ncbi:hypothetical protein GW17_00000432 [Ensete ventricosum]|nr:hypothetical protein GW17_00000432 [Ensete ventricosum]RZR79560.1 hypothetical protein BHM03_00005304 [Ensete ventricosum]